MGQRQTLQEELQENEFLKSVCSSEPVQESLWLSIKDNTENLKISLPLSMIDLKELEKIFSNLSESLCKHDIFLTFIDKNNIQTGSLGGMAIVISEWLCSSTRKEKESQISFQLSSLLVVFRHFAHFIISKCGDNENLLDLHFNNFPVGMKNTLGKEDFS